MPKYRVFVSTTASATVEVEAESKKAALEEAWNSPNFPSGTLCHQCAGQVDLGDFEVGDDVENVYLIED
jgi:hypothetical protein